jgi:hypothetical protein
MVPLFHKKIQHLYIFAKILTKKLHENEEQVMSSWNGPGISCLIFLTTYINNSFNSVN